MNLGDDLTCVAEVPTSYLDGVEGETRICMKPFTHERHDPCDVFGCREHHRFVLSSPMFPGLTPACEVDDV